MSRAVLAFRVSEALEADHTFQFIALQQAQLLRAGDGSSQSGSGGGGGRGGSGSGGSDGEVKRALQPLQPSNSRPGLGLPALPAFNRPAAAPIGGVGVHGRTLALTAQRAHTVVRDILAVMAIQMVSLVCLVSPDSC
jgi:hypothetical protein